jgi:SAM-dependent methyltransferase
MLGRARFLAVAAVWAAMALVGSGAAFAQPTTNPPEAFEPVVGQDGKDVIWVPTPDALVTKMLTMAKVGPGDVVVDLGAGDGKITIAAAKEFGAVARGVEFNPDMVALATRRAAEAGVSDKVKFIQGDIFETNFTDASVVTLYLLPTLNIRLRPTLLAMKPGTRIVSHAFDMGDWEPDDRGVADEATAYLWIVPAKVEGRWTATAPKVGPVEVNLTQSFQRLSGQGSVKGRPLEVIPESVKGRAVAFWLDDGKGEAWRVEGEIGADDRLTGTIRRGLNGPKRALVMTRAAQPAR